MPSPIIDKIVLLVKWQFIKTCQNTPQLCWGDEWSPLPRPRHKDGVIFDKGEERFLKKEMPRSSATGWFTPAIYFCASGR
ncbi:MAG: hypothetical protein A2Z19_04585 [Deltaproteobacteria bacterium RBG_16_54_18]|nr:MAG: hypothetical protein A2Z19_04585 [Deltaproteobacteria bacterium RBG_16_54_18]